MEEAPENRTANMSIKLLKFHTRKNAIFLPKDGKGAALGGWELPIKVVQQLRNNLAAQLWELRRYPDNVTLAEARKLDE